MQTITQNGNNSSPPRVGCPCSTPTREKDQFKIEWSWLSLSSYCGLNGHWRPIRGWEPSSFYESFQTLKPIRWTSAVNLDRLIIKWTYRQILAKRIFSSSPSTHLQLNKAVTILHFLVKLFIERFDQQLLHLVAFDFIEYHWPGHWLSIMCKISHVSTNWNRLTHLGHDLGTRWQFVLQWRNTH